MRAYYNETIEKFLAEDANAIQGKINRNNQIFDTRMTTQKSWEMEICILKDQLKNFNGEIIFEYTIPRLGKRIDVVLIINGIIFLLEFKTNEHSHKRSTDRQVMDYALDLKNFHKESQSKYIVPVSIATEAEDYENNLFSYEDHIYGVIRVNKSTISREISRVLEESLGEAISREVWINSEYSPTPTIIESARYMYAHHTVEDISRSDAAAKNLTETADAIHRIVNESREKNRKAICFLTGVPGAGKTLAGLNIATQKSAQEDTFNAVFLSGNGPLVNVLQEALARDVKNREKITLSEARRKSLTFINNIHKFRDNYIGNEQVPFEKIVVFDEAQRSWSEKQLSKFMREKKNTPNFNLSEPECLLEIMDRHEDWCVVVCLVGEGQEINRGEAGIEAWLDAADKKFQHWDIFASDKIESKDTQILNREKSLHLDVSLRSFRSEKISDFVHAVLDGTPSEAREIRKQIHHYPLKITRDMDHARNWIRQQQRGTERIGIIASSGALRLRPYGIWVKSEVQVEHWFLDHEFHPESSNALEQTCTEFEIQGLEIDYALLAWDGDLRIEDGSWAYYNFRGENWNHINQEERKVYKKNAYRVLLTRARQGMVIFVPKEDQLLLDPSGRKSIYDETYEYLLSCGFESID